MSLVRRAIAGNRRAVTDDRARDVLGHKEIAPARQRGLYEPGLGRSPRGRGRHTLVRSTRPVWSRRSSALREPRAFRRGPCGCYAIVSTSCGTRGHTHASRAWSFPVGCVLGIGETRQEQACRAIMSLNIKTHPTKEGKITFLRVLVRGAPTSRDVSVKQQELLRAKLHEQALYFVGCVSPPTPRETEKRRKGMQTRKQ